MTIIAKSSAFPKTVQPGVPKLGRCPRGWRRAPLKLVLHEERRPIKMKDDVEYRLVTVKRARGGVVERERLLGRDIAVKSQFVVRSGDFLISKRQIVHGACGLVPPELDGSIVSNEYSVLRGSDDIDLTYLNYLAHSIYFQQTCFHSSIGVHVEKMIFKLDRWLNWEFDLPPLPEQLRISGMLSTWDRALSVNEELAANAQLEKRAWLTRLLQPTRRPRNWQRVRLEELGTCRVGLTYTPEDVVDTGGTLVLRASNIQAGRLSFEDNVYVSCEVSAECRVEEGDILICVRNGSRDLIGKAARVDKTTSGSAFGAFMAVFRSKDSDFVFFHLQSDAFRRHVQKHLGATINQITNRNLRDFTLFLPPAEERAKAVRLLDLLEQRQALLDQNLNKLRQERQALMQQLLLGKRRFVTEEKAA